ncbi:MAG: hypothetical protein ACMXYA_02850 [Candidatus Woesearchaeota archaeon]
MAEFIDLTVLVTFAPIFGFILVWSLVYGLLSFSKTIELPQHLRALIAVMIAIITLFVPQIMAALLLAVPWFTLMFVFIIFVLIALMAFGVTREEITKAFWAAEGSGLAVRNGIIIISFIILAGVLGFVFFGGDSPALDIGAGNVTIDSSQASVDEVGAGALLATIFHPKMLGVIFLMLISLFAVLQLAK